MNTVSYSQEVKSQLDKLKAVYHQRKGQYDRLLEERKTCITELDKVKEQLTVLLQTRLVFQVAAEAARERAREHIQGLVTSALQSVFGPDISFEVILEEKRERPEAEFLVASTYGGTARVANRPEDARGGGVVDIVSLALRAALLAGARLEGFIVFDEPAKHVSEQYSRAAAELLKSLSEDMERQVIMVTHNAHLAEVGEISYRVEMRNGQSEAVRQ